MAKVVDPKIRVIGYGPEIVHSRKLDIPLRATDDGDIIIPGEWTQDGQIVVPEDKLIPFDVTDADRIVRGGGRITHQGRKAFDQAVEARATDEETIKALSSSVGRGHAVATLPVVWINLEGTCSKYTDQIFTSGKFGSYIVPSGRAQGITIEDIVVPRGIYESGESAVNVYLCSSRKNIEAHVELQRKGVSKQVASKVVQYGHEGGGVMLLPLETVAYFAKEAENNPDFPDEGRAIISQLEEFMHSHGMGKTYELRKTAPRSGSPNPTVFHDRRNFAEELIETNRGGVLSKPILLQSYDLGSEERDEQIAQWLAKREKVFSSPEAMQAGAKELLYELEKIIESSNNTIGAVTAANTPWRVQGEAKRHRTVDQMAGSIYRSVKRLGKAFETGGSRDFRERESVDVFTPFVSMPEEVARDPENRALWLERFASSVDAYNVLLEMGVARSDAVSVIPRGIKLGVVKTYNLYNLVTGYASLRQCSTVEPEMRAITRAEMALVHGSPVSDYVKQLISPKCCYVGHCPEKKFCGTITAKVPFYDSNLHQQVTAARSDAAKKLLAE